MTKHSLRDIEERFLTVTFYFQDYRSNEKMPNKQTLRDFELTKD